MKTRIIPVGSYPIHPLEHRNDNIPSKEYIDQLFQSSIHDIKLCRLWDSQNVYAQQRVYAECKIRIKSTHDISDLIEALYTIHSHAPGLRDSLGQIFLDQFHLCRLQKQTCNLHSWKKAIPGLNQLGLLEENRGIYKEAP